ncbi:MAG: stage V sporulation protein D [Bacilli bacterium]|nr:stage V sporulation protein D [Bacilli bacterium]
MFWQDKQVRIRFVVLIITFLIITIIVKVFYIEVFQYKKLNSLASDLWSRNLPITADRGKILDRNGKILADNITTTSLYLIPNQIKEKEKVTQELASILNVSYEEMKEHVFKKTSLERVHPEGRQLSFEIADKINALNYDGVYLLKESKRYYPYKNLMAQTLGFVGIDNQGLSGLELKYNDYLTGTNGSIKYYSDAKGNKLPVSEEYKEAVSGLDLTLTIDLDLQQAVERELDNVVSKYSPEAALAIAMDPQSGELLAISSRPNYNPNSYQTTSLEILNRNLPIWMTYEPGSTMKITTLAASLNEGVVNLFEDNFYDKGSIEVDGAHLHCWKRGGHGQETYLQVVENSCNPGFVSLGLKLGKDRLFSYIKNYGFGEKTGIDLIGEENGIIFDLDKIGNVELATTAFGQGISVTPIQQVRAVSASINGGTLYRPYILKNISDSTTKQIVLENSSEIIRQVITKETSDMVRFALESVVSNGTGRNAYIENYRVGGKTGTAQKVNNGRYMVGNYIVSFIGFMPADNPSIVVYVAIDNPKGVTQYGGTVAAPVAKAILESYINIKKLPPASDLMPKVYNWNDIKYQVLPDVVGKSLEEAKKILKGYTLEYSGQGNKIIHQSPSAGLYVEDNSTVKLMLSN